MKNLIACLVCLALTRSLMAQDANNAPGNKPAAAPADPAPLQLVLELFDGSHIIGTPVIDRLKVATQYADVEVPFSGIIAVEFDSAKGTAGIYLKNGDRLSGLLSAKEIGMKTIFGRAVIPISQVSRIGVGHPGEEFENSLGMKFVPVPGIDALFCIWDTRVKDYRAYAAENNMGVPPAAGIGAGEDHPVVNVMWGDAKLFCAWLTEKERGEGKIRQDQEYRLPTDKEWSAAVGQGKYPWGDQWPPPRGAGNYGPGLDVDDFNTTSPVGSFKANQYGLFDMGGNVWNWCEDWYRVGMNEEAVMEMHPDLRNDGGGNTYRVLRGGSWQDGDEGHLMSDVRNVGIPTTSGPLVGFRCVLAPVSPSP